MNDKKGKKEIEGLEQGLLNLDRYMKNPGVCECGNEYTYMGLGEYKCAYCGKTFKNEYALVREFVDKYGTNYSILEIAAMTGVNKKLIDMFIKDGRFITVERQKMCIICHQPIDSGVYCKKCALIQIDSSLDESKEQRKNLTGTLHNEDMKGTMRHGRRIE